MHAAGAMEGRGDFNAWLFLAAPPKKIDFDLGQGAFQTMRLKTVSQGRNKILN